jgi:hypothetical protein
VGCAFLQLIIVQLLVDAGIQYAFNKLISEVCKHCKKTYWPVKKRYYGFGIWRAASNARDVSKKTNDN